MLKSLTQLMGSLLAIMPYAVLVFVPFMDNLRISKRSFYVLISAFFLVNEAIIMLVFIPANYMGIIIQIYLICFLLAYLLLYFIAVRAKFYILLYVFFLVATYSFINVGLRNYIEIVFFHDTYYNLFTHENLIINCVLLCVTYPFIFRFLRKKITHAVNEIQLTAWKYLWIIPAMFFAVIFIYTGTYETEYIKNWQYVTMLIVMGLGSFLVFYVSVRMLEQTDKNTKVTQKMTIVERQLELQSEQYSMLRNHITETKTARHDLRHHLSLLQSYIDAGETEKLKMYVNEYAGALPTETEIFFCENHAVNSILRHYAGIAKNEGIQFDIRLELPENTGVSDSDFCILFGNLTENAIEACRKLNNGRFIRINSKLAGKMIAITIDNSFNDKIEKEGDVYMSLKHDGEGIGISSVKAIAEKYGGAAQFESKDSVFQASIMLRLK